MSLFSKRPSQKNDSGAALCLEGVTHRFGHRAALNGLSLEIAAGEFVSLLGPSGCGKTTALRIAAGLEQVQSGRVFMQGQEVANVHLSLPPEERSVGLVFQDFALFPHLSVANNVAFGLRKLSRKEQKSRIEETLAQVGMSDYQDAYPHMLSGGQQQRIALARAIAPRPKIVLLDEPFSGLDSGLRNQVREETLRILKTTNTATLMVTHDPEEAMFMSDRIAVMREGNIVQFGSPAELYNYPSDPFVAGFFGDLNRMRFDCVNGVAETPFGPFYANTALAECGDCAPEDFTGEIDIYIRHEAVNLAMTENRGTQARVVKSRMIGQSALVDLSLDGLNGHSPVIRARLSGIALPSEGSSLYVTCDRSQAFVFPVV
ncbi:ABC transporter ATP-binding protein [Kiloniella sp. b19]|uniref:ABC transporter ATP-binding protein n=1 Tax=Kiloniella sp. GXU_MW_B19 TaxID=3141326 RepID=UPI0031CFCCEF